VSLHDEDGGPDGAWIDGGRHGRKTRHVLFAAGQARRTPLIRRARRWCLRVLPVEAAPLLTGPVEGTGSAVPRHEDPPALLTLRRTTKRAAPRAAHALNHPRGLHGLIADTDTGDHPVTGPLRVDPGGSCFVRVRTADGTGWRVETVPLAGTPVICGPVERVTGHGFGVVRHTGPETEMLLTHEYGSLPDSVFLFELDENLFPVRRIGRSRGPHRIPSGFVQVRGFGEWALERHG